MITCDQKLLRQFIMDRIPVYPSDIPATYIGISCNGKIVAAVAYHDHNGNDIEVTCAADSFIWLRKRNIAALMHYPFEQLKCRRISARCISTNISTIRLLRKMGFAIEGVKRYAWNQDHIVGLGMLREEAASLGYINDSTVFFSKSTSSPRSGGNSQRTVSG